MSETVPGKTSKEIEQDLIEFRKRVKRKLVILRANPIVDKRQTVESMSWQKQALIYAFILIAILIGFKLGVWLDLFLRHKL